ncbi:MAG: O-antigen ligase family protein [Acetomicrobium sp.]
MKWHNTIFVIFLHIIYIGIILGNSLRIGIPFLPERKIPLSFLDMCVLLIGTLALIYLLHDFIRKKHISVPKSLKLTLLWIAFGVFSLILFSININLELSRVIYSLGYPYRMLCYLFISIFIINNISNYTNTLLKIMLYYTLVLVSIGFIIYYKFPYLTHLWAILLRYNIYFPNPDPHIYRFVSTFFDPNFLAAFLVLPIIYLIYIITVGSKNEKIVGWIILFVVSRAFILTFSRSGYLTLGLSIVSLCIMKNRVVETFNKKILLRNIAFFVGITILFLCVEEIMGGNTLSRIVERSHIISKSQTASQYLEPSAAARVENWKVGLEIFCKHPLIGVGYNNYGNVARYINQSIAESQLFGNDSSWILILATTGIIGFVLFLLGYVLAIINLIKIYRSNLYEPNIRIMSSSLTVYLISLAVSTNFNNFLFYPPIMCQCFIMYAIICAVTNNNIKHFCNL